MKLRMDLRFFVLKAYLFWADSGFGDFYVVLMEALQQRDAIAARQAIQDDIIEGGALLVRLTKAPMATCGWNLARECRGEVAVVDQPPHTIEWNGGRDAADRARGPSMIDDQSFRD
jgi:hypothetical protein